MGDDALRGAEVGGRVRGGTPNWEEAHRLEGGPGADLLQGSVWEDLLRGGPGPDLVLAWDDVDETVRCDGGVDRLIADREDRAIGCEGVTRR